MEKFPASQKSSGICKDNCEAQHPIGLVWSPLTKRFGPAMVECISNPKRRAGRAPPRILWEDAPEDCALRSNEVHVWAVELASPEDNFSRFEAVLSSDERERADRYHFELHRGRFIHGRGTLRFLLGEYLECPPKNLEFSYGSNGKPSL